MICPNCNAQNPDSGAFCVGCGQPLAQAAPQQYAPPPQQYAAPAAADDEAKDAQDNKVMGILAYLGILVLAPIFAAKDSKFAKFHANQGLILAILTIAYGVVFGILMAVFSLISWRLGAIMSPILCLVFLVYPVFAILGIVSASRGEMKELPIIGKFKILK
ncbi:MAG: DUF4870 domain-containing protein [Oscillospiraceae bacterium]|jgi:uncharacterized membrane protein|nr:DUF4870 domain-containing protein [Oscillospiraceae bacterium]